MKISASAVATAAIVVGAADACSRPVPSHGPASTADDSANPPTTLAVRSPMWFGLRSGLNRPLKMPDVQNGVDTTPLLLADHDVHFHASPVRASEPVLDAKVPPKSADETLSQLETYHTLPPTSPTPRYVRLRLLKEAQEHFLKLNGHGLPLHYRPGIYPGDAWSGPLVDNLLSQGKSGEGLYLVKSVDQIKPLQVSYFSIYHAMANGELLMWLPVAALKGVKVG